MKTTGNQTYNDTVNIANNPTLSANRITFNNTVNGNSNLTITDVYQIYYRLAGGIGVWQFSVPSYRLFTTPQWSVISSSNTNLTSTYTGTQSIIVDSLLSNGTTNLYLVRTGYKE